MKRMSIILIVSVLILNGFLLNGSANTGTLGILGSFNYTSPSNLVTMKINPGSTPSFRVGIEMDPDYDPKVDDGQVVIGGALYESDKNTPITETGWKIWLYSGVYSWGFMTPWTLEGQDDDASDGKYYSTFSKQADDIFEEAPESASVVQITVQLKLKCPTSTKKSSIYVGIRVDEKVGDQEVMYGVFWWKVDIRSSSVDYYNIDLSVPDLPAKIYPEETISRKITVFNNGSLALPIGVYYWLKLTDSNKDNVNIDDWKISILDTVRTEVYYLSVPAGQSNTCYLEITAPKKDKAPPDCNIYVYLDARVLNDTAYGEALTLKSKTSSEFTGDGGNIFGDLAISNWLYSPLFWLLIIIIIIIIGLFYKNKGGTRRTRSSKK